MPVKFLSSPPLALAYSPFGSRCSHTSSGVETNTSTNSPCSTRSRTRRRSPPNGEVNGCRACVARQAAIAAERRDEGRHPDEPRIHEQLRDLADAAHVLDAAGVAEV